MCFPSIHPAIQPEAHCLERKNVCQDSRNASSKLSGLVPNKNYLLRPLKVMQSQRIQHSLLQKDEADLNFIQQVLIADQQGQAQLSWPFKANCMVNKHVRSSCFQTLSLIFCISMLFCSYCYVHACCCRILNSVLDLKYYLKLSPMTQLYSILKGLLCKMVKCGLKTTPRIVKWNIK